MKYISSNWDEVLRLTASIRTGIVTASMILKKLANYPRQNRLAKALREIGKIERPHPSNLERVRVRGGVDRRIQAPFAAGVRHRLPEISGARAHERFAALSFLDQELRAAALERADRVEGLDLDRQPHA